MRGVVSSKVVLQFGGRERRRENPVMGAGAPPLIQTADVLFIILLRQPPKVLAVLL